MNAADLKSFIRQISKEKDLDVGVVKDAVEQAIISASKKNLSQYLDARVELDAESGELRLFVKKMVVNIATNLRDQVSLREAKKLRSDVQVGETVEVEIDPQVFGRIAAQSAKQVVMQKLRDAERQKVYDEFLAKKGEVLAAIVLRFEKRDLILAVGKNEVLLPRNEIPPISHYRVNDRLKVYVLDLDLESKGPIVKVSRTHPQLVAKLFEQEVPEIADGTVKIVNVVRDPGARTKIAVQSTNTDVDPVGACVGVKGSRVQMIVRELENEKIDIVPYSPNVKQFITNALVPAQISSIEINDATKQADVIVKQGNLSLAIGRKGQNAKLAAKLTGWKLDIHSEGEEEKLATMDHEDIQRKYLEDFLTQLERADADIRDLIHASPYNTVQKLSAAEAADLATFIHGDEQFALEIIEGAREYVEALAEMTRTNYGEDAPEAAPEVHETTVSDEVAEAEEESSEQASVTDQNTGTGVSGTA